MDESKRDEKEEESNHLPKQLDAGALFVLKSRGSWLHCGYHLTTSIVAPVLLSLPLALSLLGWFAGVVCLSVAAMVTFYSYNLLSLVLDHHAHLGHRQLRFRDMATDVLEYIHSLQHKQRHAALPICYYIWCPKAGVGPNSIFSQLEAYQLGSLILCLAYSACATAGSIYIGNSKMAPPKDYSVNGSSSNRIFGSLNAISIIATTYGNGIIPEIQATIAAPVKGKMLKGLLVCYGVVMTTFFSVGISGYWAFGNQAKGTILQNFMVDDHHKPLLPSWVLLMTNVFTLLQVAAVSVVYLQPTNEALEKKFSDATIEQFSLQNVIPRLFLRSLSVAIATLIAAMFPFFGDINAVIGAFGLIPLDFVLPMVFYNVTFKPSKKRLIFWGNTAIATIFTVLGVLGAISSIRQIILDANTYSLFANV